MIEIYMDKLEISIGFVFNVEKYTITFEYFPLQNASVIFSRIDTTMLYGVVPFYDIFSNFIEYNTINLLYKSK